MSVSGVSIDVHDHHGKPAVIVRLPKKHRVLSSTIVGGGFTAADTLLIMEVPLGYDGKDPEGDLYEAFHAFDLPDTTIGFMTAADVRQVLTVNEVMVNGVSAYVISTAGVTNALVAGERLPQALIDTLPVHNAGTINIIAIIDRPLQDCGMVNAVMTITEAKSAALKDAGVKGTGTTSDAIAIVAPIGPGSKYAGTATDAGISIAKAVRAAVATSVKKWNASSTRAPKDFVMMLDEVGVGLNELWQIVRSNDTKELNDGSYDRFIQGMHELSTDVNVNAMILAAIDLNDTSSRNDILGDELNEKGLIIGHLIGTTLSEYISGKNGISEYMRYKEILPADINARGAILSDVIAALVGGATSRTKDQRTGGARSV